MTQREKIIDRARKLAKMTQTNGASEAEATLAAKLLSDLTEEFGLTQTELTLKADAKGMIADFFQSLEKRRHKRGQTIAPPWATVGFATSKLFSTRAYLSTDHGDPFDLGISVPVIKLNFYGYPEDVAAAISLTTICYIAMTSSAEKEKTKEEQLSFEIGMADRLKERILQLKAERETRFIGTSLIVVKDALVTQEYKNYLRDEGIRLSSSAPSIPLNSAAYAKGQEAGSRVDLGQRAKINSPTLRIAP